MATGGEDFNWRETYFIFFRSEAHPSLEKTTRALAKLSGRMKITQSMADEEGKLESITLLAPEDYAALEVTYESGQMVAEQAAELAKQLKKEADAAQLATFASADARLDIMHFELIPADADPYADDEEDDLEGGFDPSAMLLVVEALTKLTKGVAVDPASGAVLE